MKLKPFLAIIALVGICGLYFGYINSREKEEDQVVETQPIKAFSSENFYALNSAPKCKFLLDSYCNYLYSPDVSGNLEIKRGPNVTKVLQGETNNGFSQVFFQYSYAKIKNQKVFPQDFYSVLVHYEYFSKLEQFLKRSARKVMTAQQRLETEKLDYDLNSIWAASVNETVLTRMIKKYPGYHQISDRLMPVELSLETRRVKRNLISEISKAIWKDDKNWKKVEKGFARLKESYLKMIPKLDIPDEVQKDWSNRISEVKLILPGSIPAISDDECSATTVNAYYYTYLNVLTICAGDFNSEDIIQTLAHEMGHSLGIDRSQYLFEINSSFGKNLASLRKQVCESKKFTCDEWANYKSNFSKSLASLDGYQPQVPEFQSCLKRRDTSKHLQAEDIQRFAKNIVSDRISALASSDRFLRITKDKVPMRNGKYQKNPNFMNPCSYYMWTQGEEPIDDELTTLMFFTAEYQCSDKSPSDKLKSAIEVAKDMSTEVLEKSLSIEGEYSGRSLLETEGYSSPNFERFADVLGSYAMAELLESLPVKKDRQNLFLASSSWQCVEPSLATHFPEESAIEKEYIFDAHTEGDQRRKELFSLPIREAIGCEKDFEFKACELPRKK